MTALDIKSAERLLGGKIYGRNRILCPGPGHGRADRSLSVMFTNTGFVVKSFAGDDWKECRDHVKAVLGLSDDRPVDFNDNRPADFAALVDERARIDRGLHIWTDAAPLSGTLVAAYLASRGLSYDGDALRFHPSCPFRQERHPAMVALMTDTKTGEPRGVHRTALLPDGSGKALPGKMMLGVAMGAVVRLTPGEEVAYGLAVTEGIETALAVSFRPIWACMTAGNMADFPVLSGIEALTIFADRDHAGMTAANDCGRRWHAAGVEVTISAPPVVGADFADMREAA